MSPFFAPTIHPHVASEQHSAISINGSSDARRAPATQNARMVQNLEPAGSSHQAGQADPPGATPKGPPVRPKRPARGRKPGFGVKDAEEGGRRNYQYEGWTRTTIKSSKQTPLRANHHCAKSIPLVAVMTHFWCTAADP